MPVRVKLPARSRPSDSRSSKGGSSRKSGEPDGFLGWIRYLLRLNTVRYSLLALVAAVVGVAFWVGLEYQHYAKLTDEKLEAGPFPNTSLLYASPQLIGVGDPGNTTQFANRLRESGYAEDARSNPGGWYHLRPSAIEIFPGQRSFHGAEPGVIKFNDNDKISSIISLTDNSPRTEFTVEPRLLTSLFDKNREKRRLVKYDDIPPVLVHAVISIEDKRFFQHSGFDPIRIVKAAIVDVREHRNAQGASTLTQQLARNLWLDSRKTYSRKFDELLITLHLEQKLTKEKIFEYYANQVPLGRRGSFAIRGFGEASQAYFSKDLRNLTLSEAATLAGLIQRPSSFNPVRNPERALARRNVVLKQMLANNYITELQYREALGESISTARQGVEIADAPYFVDLVNDRLTNYFSDQDFQDSGSRIYTTLDSDLQRDATDAVAIGMREVNAAIAKRTKTGEKPMEPQVALICLDPHTGEVKALVGGRNYGLSQLNHAVAKRPSGSVFKPFVYATALGTGLQDRPDKLTAATLISDDAHTFVYGGKTYEPTDYHKGSSVGDVTMRTAFAKSLNIPAVEVAEMVGYGNVANLAHKAGLADIRPTPAMALGAYDATPLEMAGAYTMFANDGNLVQTRMISEIEDREGKSTWSSKPDTKNVLDPRVNFLVVSLMQEVLRSGTGAGVRSRGFALPAAAKTGTSHDAWFAGFSSKLLCVVWVGMDDYQDLKMEGAKAALPIWTEFMKRAHKHRAYRDVTDFTPPDGVVAMQVDNATGGLATSLCPPANVGTEYFLDGTQPTTFCPLHQGGNTQIAGWDSTSPPPMLPNLSAPLPQNANGVPGTRPVMVVPQPQTRPGQNGAPVAVATPEAAPTEIPQQPTDQKPKEKRGFFDKLKGVFK